MKIYLCFLFLVIVNTSFCQPHKVYLLPGHGADERVFSLLDLSGYDTEVLSYPDPFEEESFSSYAKSPLYMKRTIHYILTWEETHCDANIVHIHGAKDKTLPHKNISPTVTLPHAGHMMVYTHAPEISGLLQSYLP